MTGCRCEDVYPFHKLLHLWRLVGFVFLPLVSYFNSERGHGKDISRAELGINLVFNVSIFPQRKFPKKVYNDIKFLDVLGFNIKFVDNCTKDVKAAMHAPATGLCLVSYCI